jgi:hypothetical protein
MDRRKVFIVASFFRDIEVDEMDVALFIRFAFTGVLRFLAHL